jgi:hypothetical protein
MITQQELKTRLHYDPLTGIFTWLVVKKHKLLGKQAGNITTNGYREVYIASRKYYSHRLAWLYMYGTFPDKIDHEDGVRDNNKIDNLRDVSQQQNMQNITLRSDNTSGQMGVNKFRKRWRARINVSGKEIALGFYDSFEEAVKVRKEAEVKYGFHSNHGRD